MYLEIWDNMQHKNVHPPITRHNNQISAVMKALHSVREDKSQLLEWKVRRDTTTCIAQLYTKKQNAPHSQQKNGVYWVVLVTKILLVRIVKPPLSHRKITLCKFCLETYSMYIRSRNISSVGVLYKESGQNPDSCCVWISLQSQQLGVPGPLGFGGRGIWGGPGPPVQRRRGCKLEPPSATCSSDSVTDCRRPPPSRVPQTEESGQAAPCPSCRRTTTAPAPVGGRMGIALWATRWCRFCVNNQWGRCMERHKDGNFSTGERNWGLLVQRCF